MTSKATITNTQSPTLQMYQHPAFINAVNRAANLKCLAAIRSGRLRVAHTPEPGENVRWRPRCVFFSSALGICMLNQLSHQYGSH